MTQGDRSSTFQPLSQHHVTQHVYNRRPTTPSPTSYSTPQEDSKKVKEKNSLLKLLEKIFPFLKNKDAKSAYPTPPRTPTPEAERHIKEREGPNFAKVNNENYLTTGALPATPRSYSSPTKSPLRNTSREVQGNLNTKTSSFWSSLDSSRESPVNVGSIIYRPPSTSTPKHSNPNNAAMNTEIQLEHLSKQRQVAVSIQIVSALFCIL